MTSNELMDLALDSLQKLPDFEHTNNSQREPGIAWMHGFCAGFRKSQESLPSLLPDGVEVFEEFKKHWDRFPSQDNEGYVPDRGGFKAGWYACVDWLRDRFDSTKARALTTEPVSAKHAQKQRLADNYLGLIEKQLAEREERIAELELELKNTCELQNAGISHDAFDAVCCERDTAESKLQTAVTALEQIRDEAGLFSSGDAGVARRALAKIKETEK